MKRRDFLKLTAVAGATLVAPGLRSISVPRGVNPFRVRSSKISLHHPDGREFRGIGYERLQTYADDWKIVREERWLNLDDALPDWQIERYSVTRLYNVKPLYFPAAWFCWGWGELGIVRFWGLEGGYDWETRVRHLHIGPSQTVMFAPESINLEITA